MFEIGSSLRDARARQGLDLTRVENETKIRGKYLNALEEERFDLLPGDAYAKGFLRTYADYLGLDGQLYVDEYNSRFSLGLEPGPTASPRRRARQRRLESHAVLVALAGIVAITVLVIAAWQLTGSESEPAPDSGAPVAPAVTVTELPEPGAPATTAATAVEPLADEAVVVVTAARGKSFVEARRNSATGELFYEGTLQPGKSERFVAKKIWLRLGEPENVELTLDGGPVEDFAATGATTIVVTTKGIRKP